MYRCLLFGAILLLFSCSDKAVNSNSDSTYSDLLEILVNKGDELTVYNVELGTEEVIFDAGNKLIVSFDYHQEMESIYLIIFDEIPYDYHNSTSLVKINRRSEVIELWSDSANSGEGFFTFGDINVSPDGEYLALDKFLYEGGYLEGYSLSSNEFIRFENGSYSEYTDFIVWDENSQGGYATSNNHLVYFDFENKEGVLLESPNLREYLTEEYLLEEGYVGERFDYIEAIGEEPKKVIWSPYADEFIYLSDTDSIMWYKLESGKDFTITQAEDRGWLSKEFIPIWDTPEMLPSSFPQFNDNDIIVAFDSEILESISPLNDSLSYETFKRNSISCFSPCWTNNSCFYDFYFKGSISEEKFHIAELDFLTYYYAISKTPRFWYLVVSLDDDDFEEQFFIESFSRYIDEYREDFEYFQNLEYPSPLFEQEEIYKNLQIQDIQFQELFLSFYQDRDTIGFKTKVYELLNDREIAVLDNIFSILDDDKLSSEQRLITFYQNMHNQLLNYYGKVINEDMEELKEEYLIEELFPDWYYKTEGMSRDYLTDKTYTLNH